MKTILCFILILSTAISSAQVAPAGFVIGASIVSALIVAGITTGIVLGVRGRRAQVAEEAKFQACAGKTKSEIYTLYGPPNSIVDDAQGQGGTILEYSTLRSSGGGKTAVYTRTYRKLFYLNKDNIVTSVKEDIR
jgi:hypothetical protein